ncbi:MAG: hypothetical protein U0235_25865 [Polyangiaceae bacterium]
MAALPLAALALDEGTERYLTKLGLSVIGDLASLPRDELGSRLGASARTALALANGEDGTPLDPYLPPESPEERVDLDDPVERTDTLAFVAKTLTDRLGLRIEGRGMKTHRLELVFELERSLVPEEDASARDDLGQACRAHFVVQRSLLHRARAARVVRGRGAHQGRRPSRARSRTGPRARARPLRG